MAALIAIGALLYATSHYYGSHSVGQDSCGQATNTKHGTSQQSSTTRGRTDSGYYEDPSSEMNDWVNPPPGNNPFSEMINADPDSEIFRIVQHLRARLTRLVRLGGIGQYVHERTNIERSEIFLAGRSLSQGPSRQTNPARSSSTGEQNAHIVRAQINDRIREEFPQLYRQLDTFLGHTQEVPGYVNQGGVGRLIDQIQSEFLRELSTIDFRAKPSKSAIDILTRLIQKFVEAIQTAIDRGIGGKSLTEDKKNKLTIAKYYIESMTIADLFEKGRNGLNGPPPGEEEQKKKK